MPEQSPHRERMRGIIILSPIVLAGFAPWMVHEQLLPASDFKWILGVCLLFSLLGFAVDRLISIKFLGVEARLVEMETATNRAYASVAEVEKLKDGMLDFAEKLARQQALSVMKANRFVGDDHLTERIRSISELKRTLDKLGVPDDKLGNMLNEVTSYVCNDLNSDLRSALGDAFTKSAKTNKTARRDINELRAEFDKFIHAYEVGKTAQRVEIYLREHEVEMTDAIHKAFNRLDAFLGEGRYLDLDGNVVITFPNPPVSPSLR